MFRTAEEEKKSIQVAEASRESQWKRDSFLRDLFLGRVRFDLLEPYPFEPSERPEFLRFYEKLHRFLKEQVDPVAIDATGEYPLEVIDGLRALGAFGMKVPVEYGGLGLNRIEYATVMQLLGSYDGNLTALLSAHQSIGLPQPLVLFGTEAQRRKYLPQVAAGAISAFALTETRAGSDPARMETVAEPLPDGGFLLNGAKLWCTNGTLADLLVVMARSPKTQAISAFIVETRWKGVEVADRCRFMGLKALANASLTFRDVYVPRENLIGEEGKGLKIALTTLNTGRLSLPAATVGTAKQCLQIARIWANDRAQWGLPVGKHEAITHKLADMAATVFAMEALSDLVQHLAERPDFDIRLEAAAAKEWNTTRAWEIVDETLQIRGGRGYETERSLEARGEVPVGVERMMRDSRVNRIFEGSSEIMHLFMAREAVDRHLQVAGKLIDPEVSRADRIAALPKIAAFYAAWYPTRWLGWGRWPRFNRYGALARHLRFVERAGRKLSRSIFHAMVANGPKTQRREALLFRFVDIADELFAMAAAIARAHRLREVRSPQAASGERLADLFCVEHRRRVTALFHACWSNDDALKTKVGREVLEGRHAGLESGIAGLGLRNGALVPPTIEEVRRRAFERRPLEPAPEPAGVV